MNTNRWWIYQRERFPLLTHGILIALFSLSAVAYSRFLIESGSRPAPRELIAAFIGTFMFFLLLRIADEFKDFEDDARYRPYRAVPRGLVTLAQLRTVGIGALLLQVLLALAYYPPLLWLLLPVWGYFALMSKEFFVARWLKAHPVTYVLSHMVIMPLITLYASANQWLPAGSFPHGLGAFLLLSFFVGLVIEFGRKIRAPEDEEVGVETYSFLWGRRRALVTWYTTLLLSAATTIYCVLPLGAAAPVAVVLGLLLVLAAIVSRQHIMKPSGRYAKWIEHLSGIWTVVVYGSVVLACYGVGG
jgi:hypothetical protein